MITPNPDFSFIQLKFDNSRNKHLASGMMVEVIEVTKQLRTIEKSCVSLDVKREGKLDKRMKKNDALLLSAVDETMKQVFREAGAKVIYDYLENNCHLKREEIAEKPEVFSAGLKRLLKSGAPMIEKMILKNLYAKFELKFKEKEGYEFSDYIKNLKLADLTGNITCINRSLGDKKP